jgi:hypothetical protein
LFPPFFCSCFCNKNICCQCSKWNSSHFFIHNDPWTHGKIFFQVTKYFVLHVKNIFIIFCQHGKSSLKKSWSYSLTHVHLLVFVLVGSWNKMLGPSSLEHMVEVVALGRTHPSCYMNHVLRSRKKGFWDEL